MVVRLSRQDRCLPSEGARANRVRVESIYQRGNLQAEGYQRWNHNTVTGLETLAGICSLPSCDWFPLLIYAVYPHAIGSRS
eukprot:7802243-Pyramimonas_sp.AAC.1